MKSTKNALQCITSWVTLAAIALALGSAHAATTQFYGFDNGVGQFGAHPNSDAARASFLLALPPLVLGVETFETQPPGPFVAGQLTVSFPPTAVTALITDPPPGAAAQVLGANSSDYFATSGTRFMQVETTGDSNFLLFTFSAPVNALGFYGTSFSDYSAFPPGDPIPPIAISLDGGVLIPTLSVNPRTVVPSSVNFFGVLSDTPFTTALLVNPLGTSGDGIAIDDLTIGVTMTAAVPEPSTWMLMTLGLFGVVAVARRKRRFA